jgi:hypothetical protein
MTPLPWLLLATLAYLRSGVFLPRRLTSAPQGDEFRCRLSPDAYSGLFSTQKRYQGSSCQTKHYLPFGKGWPEFAVNKVRGK